MALPPSPRRYVKRLPVSTYRAQGRGGKGLRGVRLKDEDYIEHLFIASTHHYLLFFTNTARSTARRCTSCPRARATPAAGTSPTCWPSARARRSAVFATRDYSEGRYLVLATRDGMVKKTEMRSYDTILREAGLIAIQLTGDDELVGVQLSDGDEDLLVVSARGHGPLPRGPRAAHGLGHPRRPRHDPGARGPRVALAVARDDADLLVVTGNGYGKRTLISEYPAKGRRPRACVHHQGDRQEGRAGHRSAGARGLRSCC